MNAVRRNTLRALTRFYSEGAGGSQSTPPPHAQASQTIPEVPGLSSKIIQPAVQPVGPGVDPKKTGAYKVPEYFQYDNMSFFEAEVEMQSFRCPAPSALKNMCLHGRYMQVGFTHCLAYYAIYLCQSPHFLASLEVDTFTGTDQVLLAGAADSNMLIMAGKLLKDVKWLVCDTNITVRLRFFIPVEVSKCDVADKPNFTQ